MDTIPEEPEPLENAEEEEKAGEDSDTAKSEPVEITGPSHSSIERAVNTVIGEAAATAATRGALPTPEVIQPDPSPSENTNKQSITAIPYIHVESAESVISDLPQGGPHPSPASSTKDPPNGTPPPSSHAVVNDLSGSQSLGQSGTVSGTSQPPRTSGESLNRSGEILNQDHPDSAGSFRSAKDRVGVTSGSGEKIMSGSQESQIGSHDPVDAHRLSQGPPPAGAQGTPEGSRLSQGQPVNGSRISADGQPASQELLAGSRISADAPPGQSLNESRASAGGARQSQGPTSARFSVPPIPPLTKSGSEECKSLPSASLLGGPASQAKKESCQKSYAQAVKDGRPSAQSQPCSNRLSLPRKSGPREDSGCQGSLSDTYITVSTPFLAGGELQLPNIFTAVYVGAHTILKSFWDWTFPSVCPSADASAAAGALKSGPDQRGTSSTGTGSAQLSSRGTQMSQVGIAKKAQRGSQASVVPRVTDTAQTDAKPVLSPAPEYLTRKPEQAFSYREIGNKQQMPARASASLQQTSKKQDKIPPEKYTEAIPSRKDMENVNLSGMRSDSSSKNFPNSMSGMKEECQSRNSVNKKDNDKDFLDEFAQKSGIKFIIVLEQLERDFHSQVMKLLEEEDEHHRKEAEVIAGQIHALTKITPTSEEKQLYDYDFPLMLERDMAKFNIDITKKLSLITKIHNYGVKSVLHWIYLLHRGTPSPPDKIIPVAVDLLSSIMVPCYGIIAVVGEHFAALASDKRTNVDHPPFDRMLRNLRDLTESIQDEIGSIGESCAQVLIRTPKIQKQEVEDALQKLYTQVNYAHTALSRAMEALVPVILSYAVTEMHKSRRVLDSR